MRKVFLLFVLLPWKLSAATLNCDGSQSDCQAKVNSANNGDTVQLPNGIFNWNGANVVINNKNIIFNGVGMFDSNTSQTLITGTGVNGNFLTYITANDSHTATVSNIEFTLNNATQNLTSPMLVLQGVSQYNPIANNSGFRITQVRFNCINNSTLAPGYNLVITDYVTGVVDHCWWDYPQTSTNGGVADNAMASSPGVRVGATPIPGSPPTGGWIPMFGLYNASQAYTWGNSNFGQIYYEDNLICRHGLGISGDDSGSKNVRGGTMIVLRHNSTHSFIFNSHGFGESGPDDATYTAEIYNNVGYSPVTTSFATNSFRTGAAVDFNNRYLGGWGNIGGVIHVLGTEYNRLTDPGNSIGPADATNYFDYNSHGTLTLDANHWPTVMSGQPTVYTFNPDGGSQESDTRVGSIYFRGTSSTNNQPWNQQGHTGGQNYTLNGLPGIAAGQLIGFTIRDDTIASASVSDTCDGSSANDCQGGQNLTADRCAVILSNQATDANGNVQINISGGHDFPACLLGGSAGMAPTDHWSLRFVNTFLGAPGGGYYNGHYLNGGVIYQYNIYHLMPAWLDANGSGQFLYWPNQRGEGMWTWGSLYSTDLGVHWNPATINLVGVLQGRANGGLNNAQKTGYPFSASGNTVANCRIGADPNFWGTQGPGNQFGEPISYGQNFDPNQPEYNANCAQGFPCGANMNNQVPYPHPLVTGVTPPPPSPTPTPTPTPTSTPLGPAGLEPRKRAFKPL